jgi:Zn-finger nucleic acid-binding protein
MRVMSCPCCGQAMKRKRMKGVAIDLCGEHGIWLDKGELSAIMARTRGTARRAATEQSLQKGRWEGVMYGWWSLLK